MNTTLPTLLLGFVFVALGLGSCSARPTATTEPSTATTEPAQEPAADDIAFEEGQTAKLLGVPLQEFPAPQGLNGMDELPASASPFGFWPVRYRSRY